MPICLYDSNFFKIKGNEDEIYNLKLGEKLLMGNDIWEKTRNVFKYQKDIILPVVSRDGEVIFFAGYKAELETKWRMLRELELGIDCELWKKFKSYKKQIHIIGINDVLYYFREWLLSVGAEVSVEGEEWRYFGIEEEICKFDNIMLVDENCNLLDVLHEEYRGWMEDDILELKSLITKPCKGGTNGKCKILFYMPSAVNFVDCTLPLIEKYLKMGNECIIALLHSDDIIFKGQRNLKKMIEVLKYIKILGGVVCDGEERELYLRRYFICFTCSEYSGILPPTLRKLSNYIISLQTTALYTHMYGINGRFEEVFSNGAWEETDYLIASNYIAEWICERAQKWDEKILRFGYPKLDKLYQMMINKPDVPKEWEKKIVGKKVFLFTAIEETWLDRLINKEWVIIWRPHPQIMQKNRGKIKSIKEKYSNIIVDDMLAYYAAFKVSDALVSRWISSIMVNYLYTGKPVCFLDNSNDKPVINFRREAWYKSLYAVRDEEEMFSFLEMVSYGGDWGKLELAEYRQEVVSNFDGKVCDRIYDYFQYI